MAAAPTALPEVRAPTTWGLAKGSPPREMIKVFIKETVFESATTNKFWTAWELQAPMVPWFDRFDALMTLDFGQNLRSADQFSEAKQTQPVHLQHHPACQSSILLLYDTLSLSITYLHAVLGYLPSFSYSEGNRQRCNTLEEIAFFKIFRHTMVIRRRASVLLHA